MTTPSQPEILPPARRAKRLRPAGSRMAADGVYLAMAQVLDLLGTIDLQDLRARARVDSQFYTRLIQSLGRLSEVALKAERDRAERKAKLERQLAKARKGKGGLPPETVSDLEQQLRLL